MFFANFCNETIFTTVTTLFHHCTVKTSFGNASYKMHLGFAAEDNPTRTRVTITLVYPCSALSRLVFHFSIPQLSISLIYERARRLRVDSLTSAVIIYSRSFVRAFISFLSRRFHLQWACMTRKNMARVIALRGRICGRVSGRKLRARLPARASWASRKMRASDKRDKDKETRGSASRL